MIFKRFIITMLTFTLLTFLTVIVSSTEEALIELQQQITNTEELILLYQQKLHLLKSIYQEKYSHPFNTTHTPIPTLPRQRTSSPHIVLINKFEQQYTLFQNPLVLHNNRLVNLQNSQTITEFIGEVLIVQHNAITTLVGGKLSILKIKQQQGGIKTEEEYVGMNADKLPTIWHRNYNIKDGQDLVIQWLKNKIYLRGKELNVITLPQDEQVLALYSLNQYKVIFASNHRIGIINSRSLQIGQFESASNITKIPNKTSVSIRKTVRQDAFVIALLSTGEIVKYLYPKIVSIQILPTLTNFNLFTNFLTIQYLHPYLFLADGETGLVKVFQGSMGRFQNTIEIDLRNPFTGISFYKQNQSYRMFLSQQGQTKIYELLMPKIEQPVSSSNYFKIIGVTIVLCIFIYFKWFKASNTEIDPKQMQNKRVAFERTHKDNDKEKPRFTQSEVEQFLRRQSLKKAN